jgi:hypothetical protein
MTMITTLALYPSPIMGIMVWSVIVGAAIIFFRR